MSDVVAQLPEIIERAAASPLGILALMIVALSLLGFFFFREASERTRLATFALMFIGVATRTPTALLPPAARDWMYKLGLFALEQLSGIGGDLFLANAHRLS